jgi:hypothetical protein
LHQPVFIMIPLAISSTALRTHSLLVNYLVNSETMHVQENESIANDTDGNGMNRSKPIRTREKS